MIEIVSPKKLSNVFDKNLVEFLFFNTTRTKSFTPDFAPEFT